MGMRISPLRIEILLGLNPLKSRILVRRLAAAGVAAAAAGAGVAARGCQFVKAKCDTPEITKVELHWKMPLTIHDDFRGVDFWCAIFCP